MAKKTQAPKINASQSEAVRKLLACSDKTVFFISTTGTVIKVLRDLVSKGETKKASEVIDMLETNLIDLKREVFNE
jgi:hypothetical protein